MACDGTSVGNNQQTLPAISNSDRSIWDLTLGDVQMTASPVYIHCSVRLKFLPKRCMVCSDLGSVGNAEYAYSAKSKMNSSSIVELSANSIDVYSSYRIEVRKASYGLVGVYSGSVSQEYSPTIEAVSGVTGNQNTRTTSRDTFVAYMDRGSIKYRQSPETNVVCAIGGAEVKVGCVEL
jgi:hypothetical protein